MSWQESLHFVIGKVMDRESNGGTYCNAGAQNSPSLHLAKSGCVLDMVTVEEEVKRVWLVILVETVVLEENVHVNTDQYMSK